MAADSGCKICKCLCRFRDDFGPDEAGELHTNPFTRFRYVEYDDRTPCIKFLSKVSWLQELVPFKEIFLHISDPKVTPEWWPQFLDEANKDLLAEPWRVRGDMFPHRSIPVNTGDPEVLKLALEWLKTCKSEHGICEEMSETQDPKYHPTRLLDITSVDTQTCHLIVVENGRPIDDSGYVALSHCWGTEPSFLTLTTDNLDELQRGIPFHHLPKSFVESIQACRKLGFRYLWIDSLCIIQSGPGSEEDWQSHVATMDLIYANCELNLAVACASNAEQGAFGDRDPDFLQTAFVYVPITMNLHDATGTSSTNETNCNHSGTVEPFAGDDSSSIKAESATHDDLSCLVTVLAGRDFQSALWDLPLQKRSWVVQERFMAPRTLYFGKDRIYWECNEILLNEYLPRGLLESGHMFDEHYKRPFTLPRIVTKPTTNQLTEEDIASLHVSWHKFVSAFSETELTYPNKDKFVAIAAVAKRFDRVLSSQYIAGFFHSDLPLGLLWSPSVCEYYRRVCKGGGWSSEDGWREEIHLDNHRDSAYRAPSWSWASVDDRAYFNLPDYGYGGLHSGLESQKTIATVVTTCVKVVDQRNPYGQLSSAEITIEGPISYLKPLSQECLRVVPTHTQGERRIERCNETNRLVALHIFEQNLLDRNGAVRPRVGGLVLSPSGTGTYRRIGFYECQGPLGSRYPASNFERVTVTIV